MGASQPSMGRESRAARKGFAAAPPGDRAAPRRPRGPGVTWGMPHKFLSPEWFAMVDDLVARAGDLKIPAAMKAAEINITVTSPDGSETKAYLKDGLLSRGHHEGAPTSLRLGEALARKVFVEADTVAGVQAFLAGELQADGDLAKLVAMQMEEPSEPQKQLARAIAAQTLPA